MIDPLFWLGLSILLVAVSLTAVLVAALPALHEIARAARSVEKLADTLRRELPPTLEAIRLTGMEISDLTDDINEGVNSATQVVKQVERSLDSAKQQAKKVQVTTKSVFTGLKAAWKTFTRPSSNSSSSSNSSNSSNSSGNSSSSSNNNSPRRINGQLSASQRMSLESRERYNSSETSHPTDSYCNLNNHHATNPSHSQSGSENLTKPNLGKEVTPSSNLPPRGFN